MKVSMKWSIFLTMFLVVVGCAGFNIKVFDTVKKGAFASITLDYAHYSENQEDASFKNMVKSTIKEAVGAGDKDIDSQLKKIDWAVFT